MAQAIEAVFENDILRPLHPIEGVQEHETVTVILCRRPNREGLRKLAGTLTQDEADAMQRLIDEEFERVEGEW